MWTAQDRNTYRGRRDSGIPAASLAALEPVRIFLDLSFASSMDDKEVRSLALQVSNTYGFVRRCAVPAKLTLTSCDFDSLAEGDACQGSRILRALHRANAATWSSEFVAIEPRDLATSLRAASVPTAATHDGIVAGGVEQGALPVKADCEGEGDESKQREARQRENNEAGCWASAQADPVDVVYLSPDAEDVLGEVSMSTAYVFGGIVDRVPTHNLSTHRAAGLGVRTARLPLKETGCLPAARSPILNIDTAVRLVLAALVGSRRPSFAAAIGATAETREAHWARLWRDVVLQTLPRRLLQPHRQFDERSKVPATRDELDRLSLPELRQLNLKGRLLQAYPRAGATFERREGDDATAAHARWTTVVVHGDGRQLGAGSGGSGRVSDSLAAWEALRTLASEAVAEAEATRALASAGT